MCCDVGRGGGVKVLELLGEGIDVGRRPVHLGLEGFDEAERLVCYKKIEKYRQTGCAYLSARPISSMGSSSMSTEARGISGVLSSEPAASPKVSNLSSPDCACLSVEVGSPGSCFELAAAAEDAGFFVSVLEAVRERKGLGRELVSLPVVLPPALPAAAASFEPAGAMNVSVKLENIVNGVILIAEMRAKSCGEDQGNRKETKDNKVQTNKSGMVCQIKQHQCNTDRHEK